MTSATELELVPDENVRSTSNFPDTVERMIDSGLGAGTLPTGEPDFTAETVARWERAPTDELVDYVIGTYHEPLRRDLPAAATTAQVLAKEYGAYFPELLPAVAETVAQLRQEVFEHLWMEERVVFPAIRSGSLERFHVPLAVMKSEHDLALLLLDQLRDLTSGYVAPPGVDIRWQALYAALAEIDVTFRVHTALETRFLLPRTAEPSE